MGEEMDLGKEGEYDPAGSEPRYHDAENGKKKVPVGNLALAHCARLIHDRRHERLHAVDRIPHGGLEAVVLGCPDLLLEVLVSAERVRVLVDVAEERRARWLAKSAHPCSQGFDSLSELGD